MSEQRVPHACRIAKKFLMNEQRLRKAVEAIPDIHHAAELADRAISWQRRRFAHIGICTTCLRLEEAS